MTKEIIDGNLFLMRDAFYWCAEAKKVVPIPTKVECLSGITIKMAALALEHSVAVTGL